MVGIFLGSFNPPHVGHASVINAALNYSDIDHVYVIPAWQNPNKSAYSVVYEDRYKMCKNAFKSEFVTVSDVEKHIQPTYSYELLNIIHETWTDFKWIVTPETMKELLNGDWKHSTELLENNRFVVIGTDENELVNLEADIIGDSTLRMKYNPEFVLSSFSTNVSSTMIRKLINSGIKHIYPMVTRENENYIFTHNLYK